MSRYNTESLYRATIVSSITSTDLTPLTIKLSKTPSLSQGFLTISPNTENEEIVYYNSKDDVGKTITIQYRGISPSTQKVEFSDMSSGVDYSVTTYLRPHTINDSIRGDINHIQINANPSTSGNNTFSGDNTFTGKAIFNKELRVPVYADATARDVSITSPQDGEIAYLNSIEDFCSFKNGVWLNGLGGGGGGAVFHQDSTTDGTITGDVNGTNTNFVLSALPGSSASVVVVYNGLTLEQGASEDYVLTGKNLVFNVAPTTGSRIVAIYPEAAVGSATAITAINSNTNAVNGELYRSSDDSRSLYFKDEGGDLVKLVDATSNKIPEASVTLTTTGTGNILRASTLVSASETAEGIVERATDAEVLAGTDTTRYVSPKQVKDNYGIGGKSTQSISATNSSGQATWNGTIPAGTKMIICNVKAYRYEGGVLAGTENQVTLIPGFLNTVQVLDDDGVYYGFTVSISGSNITITSIGILFGGGSTANLSGTAYYI